MFSAPNHCIYILAKDCGYLLSNDHKSDLIRSNLFRQGMNVKCRTSLMNKSEVIIFTKIVLMKGNLPSKHEKGCEMATVKISLIVLCT